MLDVFPYWSPDIDQCLLVSRCDLNSGENSRLLTTVGPLCQRLSPGGTGVCDTHVMLKLSLMEARPFSIEQWLGFILYLFT